MKDGDFPLTNKPNPWYQMIVEKKLDTLIWSQFQYTEENCKEIEALIEKLEDFKRYYQVRINEALDKSMILWYTQRVESVSINLDYYKRNYEDRKGVIK